MQNLLQKRSEPTTIYTALANQMRFKRAGGFTASANDKTFPSLLSTKLTWDGAGGFVASPYEKHPPFRYMKAGSEFLEHPAYNLKVVGSNSTPATKSSKKSRLFTSVFFN